MPDSGELDEPGRGEALRDVPGGLDGDQLILAAVQDERGHAHGGENVADIDLLVHPVQRREHPGAGSVPDIVDERLDLVFVLHSERAHRFACLGSRRIDSQRLIDLALVGVFAAAPREVRRPQRSRRAAADDERCRPLRIGRREQDAHRPALRQAVKGGSPRSDGVHHGSDVVHAGLEARGAADRIGHAGAALVEPDQPRERPQVGQEVRKARKRPLQLHMGDKTGDEDEIERPVTDQLIGDVYVAAQRIPCLRPHRHILAHGNRVSPMAEAVDTVPQIAVWSDYI